MRSDAREPYQCQDHAYTDLFEATSRRDAATWDVELYCTELLKNEFGAQDFRAAALGDVDSIKHNLIYIYYEFTIVYSLNLFLGTFCRMDLVLANKSFAHDSLSFYFCHSKPPTVR